MGAFWALWAAGVPSGLRFLLSGPFQVLDVSSDTLDILTKKILIKYDQICEIQVMSMEFSNLHKEVEVCII